MLAAFLLVLLAAPTPSRAGIQAEEPSPWSWTDRGPKFLDVSCSEPGRCVAVGESRNLLRSNPAPGGGLAWSSVGLASSQALVAVDCTGDDCVAVSGGNGTTAGVSRVFRSADAGQTWSGAVQLPAASLAPKVDTRVAADVACDPTGSCVIAGPAGGIWRSAGDGGWNPLKDSSLALPYRALACPAAGLCVLVGSGGKGAVLRNSDATRITAAGVGNLGAIACESAGACTAAGSLGEVVSIEAPFRGWDDPVLLPNALNLVSLACPAAETCVGITGKGGALRTTARSAGEWRKRPTGTANLQALDCVDAICVAAGKVASWFASADTGSRWEPVNEVAKLNAVTCPAGTGGTCVAGGMENIARSTSQGDLWNLPISDVTGLGIDSVSCAGFPGCLALGKDKTLASADTGVTWVNRQPAGSVAAGPAAETCVSSDQCMGVGGGAIFTTFDGARTGWSIGSIPTSPGEMLKGIACPTAERCVVASSEGIYRGDLSTVGGEIVWTWIASDADPSDPLNGIACATASSCTAVGFNGQVLTTTDPELLTWSRQRIGSGPPANRPPLLAVACPADGICVAGGNGGYIATTTSGWTSWSLDQVGSGNGPQPAIAGFGCETATRCVAVGDTVFSGARAG